MTADGIPVIRLQLEGMKATILHALLDYEARLSAETRAAVERFCSPENLQAVIDAEVARAIRGVISEEVERFYRYGDGRAVIREAVNTRLGRGE